MQWHKIELSHPQVISGESEKIHRQIFEYLKVLTNGDITEIAVIGKMEQDSFLMFFSPKVCKLMKFIIDPYNPQPCDEPPYHKRLQFFLVDNAIKEKICQKQGSDDL
ncbi:MAG: hypothetical protein ABR936_16415 [Bacteroidota bacterium]|jgi:hypothetical protein